MPINAHANPATHSHRLTPIARPLTRPRRCAGISAIAISTRMSRPEHNTFRVARREALALGTVTLGMAAVSSTAALSTAPSPSGVREIELG